MKERPILFSGPMVRAILEGRKTQTRRIVKLRDKTATYSAFGETGWPESMDECGDWHPDPSPFGVPGDRLWVKETFWMHSDPEAFGPDVGNVIDSSGRRRIVGYAASMDADSERCANDYGAKKRPSIHMPRWASRITLEVIRVRVERLHNISEADAVTEGVFSRPLSFADAGHIYKGASNRPERALASDAFRDLWESINGEGSWAADPWVWVVEFKLVAPSASRKAGGV